MAVFKLSMDLVTALWRVHVGDVNDDLMTSMVLSSSSVYISGVKTLGSALNSVLVSLNEATGQMNWAYRLTSTFSNQISDLTYYNEMVYGVGTVNPSGRNDT
jgi:outer membrane protein assembly factor BamB